MQLKDFQVKQHLLNSESSKMDKTRLLFLVTEDWYFVSHRLSLAVAAKESGYDVVVATREAKHGDIIRQAGIRLIPFELSRRGGDPFSELFRLVKLFCNERPDILHLVAMKPVVYGGIAALIARVPRVIGAVAGLGWLFTSENRLQKKLQPILRTILARLLSFQNFQTIVQNTDDFEVLKKSGVPTDRLQLIKGSGVDVDLFTPIQPDSSGAVTVVLVARMLWDKGISEFVQAAILLKSRYEKVRFVLVGDPDPANPAAIPEKILRGWNDSSGVEWWGRCEDIPKILEQVHIACLPSYREGLPKSLIEAAAAGLPIVTTDTPGCREVVQEGFNGFLVPVRDSRALAEALAKLIENSKLRTWMGKNSRERAIKEFSSSVINRQVLDVYRGVMS